MVGDVDGQDDKAALHELLAESDDVVGVLVSAAAVLEQHRRMGLGAVFREVEISGDAILADAVELDVQTRVTFGCAVELVGGLEGCVVVDGIGNVIGRGGRDLRDLGDGGRRWFAGDGKSMRESSSATQIAATREHVFIQPKPLSK